MNNLDQHVEQQVKRYEAHLKHLDELFDKAAASDTAAAQDKLKTLKARRDAFAEHIEALKHGKTDITTFEEDLIAKSGPMGVWDAIALELEKLIEAA